MADGITPTVFVVEDDEGVRSALQVLLRLKGLRARGFASAEEFLAALSPDWAGCMVVDLRMPGMSGVELLERLRQRACTLPAIVVTAHGDVANTRSSFLAGAADFFEKPIDNDALLAAIRKALDQDAARREEARDRERVLQSLDRLTSREREVLDLVADGRHNREIAAALGISPRTVEVYKSRMMEKLQVRRIPELVRLVLLARGRSPKA